VEIPLNSEQERAKTAPFKPLLIVAGAGTGKTRVLTSRLLHLTEQGAAPESICAITFTNKAAREMKERLEGRLEGGTKTPFVGTFHSLGARILRVNAKLLGRSSNFTIFDEGDSFSLLKKAVKNYPYAKKLGAAFFRNKISRIKDGGETEAGKEGELAAQVYADYEEALKKNNAFDFDDLIQKPVLLFQNYPTVLKKYRDAFRHILVDEYQDVSRAQHEFVKLLAHGAESLSLVGDSDQTIYSWRGSDVNIFLGFHKDWPRGQVVFLNKNYRSQANIIYAASTLIAGNSERPPLAKEHPLSPTKEGGSKIMLFEAALPDTEAEWIADQIEKNFSNQESVGVLYRTNAQSRALEQAFLAREIPYIIFGGVKFYERREVKDIMAAVRYAANPADEPSAERLQKTFGKRRFPELLGLVALAEKLPPLEMLKAIIRTTDYFDYLEKNFVNFRERRENIAELLRFAGTFENLTEFLEQVSLLQSTDETTPREKAVHMMTIHLAKGLEFDQVFVAGVAEGILPHARSLSSNSELEEERRLLYVAMTRARSHLALSFYDLPSRFLTELPGDAVSFQSETSDNNSFTDSDERYITLD
jgi:DNA helicase-2/ATP-dependent DNA helicase PcrA